MHLERRASGETAAQERGEKQALYVFGRGCCREVAGGEEQAD